MLRIRIRRYVFGPPGSQSLLTRGDDVDPDPGILKTSLRIRMLNRGTGSRICDVLIRIRIQGPVKLVYGSLNPALFFSRFQGANKVIG